MDDELESFLEFAKKQVRIRVATLPAKVWPTAWSPYCFHSVKMLELLLNGAVPEGERFIGEMLDTPDNVFWPPEEMTIAVGLAATDRLRLRLPDRGIGFTEFAHDCPTVAALAVNVVSGHQDHSLRPSC
jgi:hypothetical protein